MEAARRTGTAGVFRGGFRGIQFCRWVCRRARASTVYEDQKEHSWGVQHFNCSLPVLGFSHRHSYSSGRFSCTRFPHRTRLLPPTTSALDIGIRILEDQGRWARGWQRLSRRSAPGIRLDMPQRKIRPIGWPNRVSARFARRRRINVSCLLTDT